MTRENHVFKSQYPCHLTEKEMNFSQILILIELTCGIACCSDAFLKLMKNPISSVMGMSIGMGYNMSPTGSCQAYT